MRRPPEWFLFLLGLTALVIFGHGLTALARAMGL